MLDNGKAVQRTLPQVFVYEFEMMICEDVSVQLKTLGLRCYRVVAP
jgi:hypothetical protein